MKKLLTPRWLIVHTIVLLALIVLVNLGFWQLRRLEQRQALNASILAGLNAPVTVLTGEAVEPAELQRRRVAVSGTFDNEAAVIILNRPFQGEPGVHLVTPLKITGSDHAVLVDRGWIPLADAEGAKWRSYDLNGEVTVNGVAYPGQAQPEGYLTLSDPTPAPGQSRLDRWFRIDIERMQAQLPYLLLPIFVEQSPEAGAAATGAPRQEDNVNVTLDQGPHLGYAIQWFSFALILVITYVVFVRQEAGLKRETQNKG